ncbi:hypothetical protein NG895_14235 [Aeoliella sp. ICT_H6.2]|uniref:NolW-like domain-containing protein n=1 Tax=Aeoliella straminimaris TaxID=2954799 RepID=A0A9X2F9V8_9BACT|nr:secretin N-terminal domain-containing protein [Aeoliella straminimaris]MCO6045065.1 hypothetical protein [Aeoliella straminimaris]
MDRMFIARLSIFTASGLIAFCSLGAQVARAQEEVPANDPPQPASSEAAAESSIGDQQLLQFSFAEASWPMVLQWIAEKAELSLDLADEPEGTFNYIDDKRYTVTEAIDVMNGYLLPRGYVLLRRDQFLVAMKTDNPMLPNLIPTVPASQLERFGNNELLRIVVQVDGFTPEQVASQVTQILGPKGVASPLDSSGALVLQGFGKSLREAVQLLADAKAPPADDELIFRSFTLRHIPAMDAERQIQNLFGLGTNPFQASMQRRAAWRERRERGGDREGNENRPAGPAPLVDNIAMNMKVSSLRQTNSLLVTATPAAIELVENILQTIDVQPSGERAGQFTSNVPELRVYKVENSEEDDVAETVDSVMPGVVINEDGRHNAIHVLATPAEHAQVEQLIEIIDSGGVGDGMEVIPLTQSDPLAMCDMLNSLFKNEDRDDRPVIMPGFQNRSLMVRATSSQMAEIRKALASFNEGGGMDGVSGDGGRFRRLPLGGRRDAEQIARTVKNMLDTNRQFDNRIRVVVPDDRADTEAPERSSNELRRVPLDEEDNQANRATTDHTLLAAFEEQASIGESADADSTGEAQAAAEAPAEESPAANRNSKRLPRVTIEVRGSELFVYSNDAVALDKVEQTVRDLVRQMPTRTQWTVFFLRAAPADTVAQTLVDLLQSDANANAVIGAGPDYNYNGLVDQTIRIVPDLRTNSLFISGSDEQIERAEKFLEFLDTNDLPGSLRDREPRSIPVKYADVNDVAQMVRELYKDYMVDPLTAVSGGDDRRNRESQARVAEVLANQAQRSGLRPSGIQLTLSVDEASSTLLVSCNDTLFEQIRQLVRQRDEAAEDSQPVTQVLRVHPSSAEQIRSVLSGLSTEPIDEQSSRDRRRERERYERRR